MNIYLNTHDFEMDVRALLMAFFPGTELVVSVAAEPQEPVDVRVCVDDNKIYISYRNNMKQTIRREEPCRYKDRKLRRDQMKQLLYRLLSECLDRTLPWGTLTGIRPVKQARLALEQGVTPEELDQKYEQYYYISPKKRKLMLDIAQTELEVLKDVPYRDGYSLYAGIPFCPSTCAYCSFTSYPLKVWEKEVDDYVELLCREIDETVGLFADKKLCSVYVGGGTPTTLLPHQLDKLLTKLNEVSYGQPVRELTVEAGRPDSITREKLTVLREHGVSRISINPQTMQQKTLDCIGRRHTVGQTVEAYELARELGFDNINMDLIMGLPGETPDDVASTMEQIRKLAPDSLTVHSLALKRAARLRMFREDYEQYKSVNTQEQLDMVYEYAHDMQLVPYYLYRQKNMTGNMENVGFAKRDKIGIYNILIMEEMQTIAAVGAGGSTKLVIPEENRIERVENVKEVRNYMTRFDEMLERKRSIVNQERKEQGWKN